MILFAMILDSGLRSCRSRRVGAGLKPLPDAWREEFILCCAPDRLARLNAGVIQPRGAERFPDDTNSRLDGVCARLRTATRPGSRRH